MALNPVTNAGGKDRPELDLPDWEKFGTDIDSPGATDGQDMIELGKYSAEIVRKIPNNFRILVKMKLLLIDYSMFLRATDRQWLLPIEEI